MCHNIDLQVSIRLSVLVETKPCYYFKVLFLVCSVGNQANWKSKHIKITCSTQPYEIEQKIKVKLKSIGFAYALEHGVSFTFFTT